MCLMAIVTTGESREAPPLRRLFLVENGSVAGSFAYIELRNSYTSSASVNGACVRCGRARRPSWVYVRITGGYNEYTPDSHPFTKFVVSSRQVQETLSLKSCVATLFAPARFRSAPALCRHPGECGDARGPRLPVGMNLLSRY